MVVMLILPNGRHVHVTCPDETLVTQLRKPTPEEAARIMTPEWAENVAKAKEGPFVVSPPVELDIIEIDVSHWNKP